MAANDLTRGERTRSAILEAAHALFLENGYGGTSMRQIAEAAGGIAVGGIYNHFASKEDIFKQLLADCSPMPALTVALSEAEGKTAPEILASALRSAAIVANENIDFMQLVYIDAQKFESAHMSELIEGFFPVIAGFALRVKESGGLRPGLDPLMITRFFSSLLIGFALTERVAFSDGKPRVPQLPEQTPEVWLDALVDVFLCGVAGEN